MRPCPVLHCPPGGPALGLCTLGEFGATILFAGNYLGRTQTISTAIYLGFEVNLQIAVTLSVILVVVAQVAILLVRGWLSSPLDAP